jgi:hypothetical protein
MSFYHDILVFLHLVGLALGLGVGIANLFIARGAAASESPDAGAALRTLPAKLSTISTVGLGVLIVTGVLLLLNIGFTAPFRSVWFWLKMIAVAGMVVVVYFVYQGQAQIRQGKTPQFAEWLPMAGMAIGGLALLATLFAVFTFSFPWFAISALP